MVPAGTTRHVAEELPPTSDASTTRTTRISPSLIGPEQLAALAVSARPTSTLTETTTLKSTTVIARSARVRCKRLNAIDGSWWFTVRGHSLFVGAGCVGAGKGARPDRTTDQGRRPNRAPPPVIRRRFHDGAIPPEQAVRLVAARRISPEATYGCGSAPESDRLPLLRWVKL